MGTEIFDKEQFQCWWMDYNLCQNKAFPKRRTVTLTPFWWLLFNLPENILSTVTTCEGVRQFWEITLPPLDSLEFLPQMCSFLLVVHVWLHIAIIPILGSKYKESILHLCSLQMSAFNSCTILLPLIMFFFTQWFAVLHLLVMLRFILKYLSRDLVCFTFICAHVFSLHLLLLSSF